MRICLFTFSFFFLFISLQAQGLESKVLDQKEQAVVIDEILEYRLDSLLPRLMEREGVDMWILISREYNEDPVLKTILPSSWLSARRRTIFVFYKKGDTFDKIAIARYNVGRLLQGAWDVDVYPNQFEALSKIIQENLDLLNNS